MLKPEIQDAINKQINCEIEGAYAYLAMAAHFEGKNLNGFASWMHQQYTEEMAHAMRLFNYLLDRGGEILLEAIPKPKNSFDSIRDVFEHALKQEQNNTNSINALYALASKLNDYATLSHLQWFLDEQVEEEKLFGEVLGQLDIAGDDRSALLVLNQQLGTRVADPTPM